MKKTYYEKAITDLLPQVEKEFFEKLDVVDPTLINDLPTFHKALSVLDPGFISMGRVGGEQFYTMMNTLFQCYHFRRCGFPVYNFSQNLINSLMVTNQNNIETSFIRFPHETTYLSFEGNTFTIYHTDTGDHNVHGAFITQEEDNGFRYWRILLCGESNKNSKPELGEYDDALFYYRIKFPKNTSIKETILDCIERDGDDLFTNDLYLKQMDKTLPLIANIALYMNTDEIPSEKTKEDIPECLTKKPKKIRQWKRKYSNISKLKYYFLGTHITNILDQDKQLVGDNVYERMVHTYTWIVRGHWHTYWVGKGRINMRVNWIKPYWKSWKNKGEKND